MLRKDEDLFYAVGTTLSANRGELNVHVSKMSTTSAAMFTTFQHINNNATATELAIRGHGRLEECWEFFASLPSPTLLTWWRYSAKTELNQHIIDELPSLAEGSDLSIHHFARNASLALERPGKIIPITNILPFLMRENLESS